MLARLTLILVIATSTRDVASANGANPTTRRAATTTTTTRAARPARDAALQAAVAELTKEIQATLAKGLGQPRTTSDYFEDRPKDGVTSESVAAFLNRGGGADPRVQAYVKWQLLSALPEKAEDPKLVTSLLRAYQSAPPPYPRPALDPRDRMQYDRLVRTGKQGDLQAVEDKLAKAVEEVDVSNGPILAYRDELLRRLPGSYDTFAAAFKDAVARLEAGLDVADFVEQLNEDVKRWTMTGGSTPQQLSEMLRSVRNLRNQHGPAYYDRVEWDAKARRLEWKTRRNDLNDGKHLDDLVAFLTEQVKNPTGELKFKDRPGRR